MKLRLTYLQILLAVIVLIAGGAMMSSVAGLAVEGSDAAVGFSVAGDSTPLPANASDRASVHAAATSQESYHAGCGLQCSSNCMSSTGSSCCNAAVPLTNGDEILDRASVAAYGIDSWFLGTGMNPEALLQPPRFFA